MRLYIHYFLAFVSIIFYIQCKAQEKKYVVEEVIAPQYLYIEGFIGGYLSPVRDSSGKYGLIDTTGSIVLPFQNKYEIFSFSEGLAAAKKNGKYGYIDKTGKEIIPFQYDHVFAFTDGLGIVAKNEKYGLIDKAGKELLPLVYNSSSLLFFPNPKKNTDLLENDGKWDLININKNKFTIIAQYDSARYSSEGLTPVKKNGKWGFINKNGTEVIALKYKYVTDFHKGFSFVRRFSNKEVFIDTSGKETALRPDENDYYSYEGFLKIHKFLGYGIGYKYGFMDKKGKTAVPLKYSNAQNFSNGLAAVRCINPPKNFSESIVMDSDNPADTNIRYMTSVSAFHKDCWGFIDTTGKEITALCYDEVRDFAEGVAAVKKKDKWGFIDKTGKEITRIEYNKVTDRTNGFIAVEKDYKWGFIDSIGKEITPFKYNNVSIFSDQGVAMVMQIDKSWGEAWGLIDLTGKEITPLKYNNIKNFHDGFAAVEDLHSGLWGFIDIIGKEVTPLKYSTASDFYKGFATVEINGGSFSNRNGKWGFVKKIEVSIIPKF